MAQVKNQQQAHNQNSSRHQSPSNMRSSSDLTNLNIAPGIDYQSILEQMKNSKPNLGGFQNAMGHSSLMVPGPTPKADPSQIFLSP